MTPPDQPKNRILFVDDDRRFLDMISELLQAQQPGVWQVFLAGSSAQALSILRENSIDLVVLDIQMPVVDGIQFLRLLERKYPNLRKSVLTAHADEARRTECLEHGAELFLEKPATSEGYETLFAALRELAALSAPDTGFRGVLAKAGLNDVIQLECVGRRSSILEVSTSALRGRIYLEDGAIIHAMAGTLKGEAALHRLLALAGGDFSLRPFEPPPERSIEGQWEFLLVEAARKRDEGTGAPAESATAAGPQLEPAAAPTANDVVVDEIILCSSQGQVLHEWQCRNVDGRLKLFTQLARAAGKIAQAVAAGRFDRWEVNGQSERVIVQLQPDRQVLVRTRRSAAAPPPAPSPKPA